MGLIIKEIPKKSINRGVEKDLENILMIMFEQFLLFLILNSHLFPYQALNGSCRIFVILQYAIWSGLPPISL